MEKEREFTVEDLQVILESLNYTKLRFEEYQKYPSYEYKLQQIDEIAQVIRKVRDEISALKSRAGK